MNRFHTWLKAQSLSTWLKLALLTFLFLIYGVVAPYPGGLLYLFSDFVTPRIVYVLLMIAAAIIPPLLIAWISARLITDWRSWAISLPIQAACYILCGLAYYFASTFTIFFIIFDLLPAINTWSLMLIALPELFALQALGFGIKRLLYRRKGNKARPSAEETALS